eukprot:s989_g3.t1
MADFRLNLEISWLYIRSIPHCVWFKSLVAQEARPKWARGWTSSMTLNKSSSLPAILALGTTAPKLAGHEKQQSLRYATADDKKSAFATFKPADVSQQVLEYVTELQRPGWRQRATPEPEELPLTAEDLVPKNQRYPRVTPAWLKHEKQVLRFYAFFQETVTERADENSRKRHIIIMYYLEDGTVSMSEPRIENSGIVQGSFLKRQRVSRNDGSGFIGPEDLRCGIQITLFGRTYHITGCDSFTRWYYREIGVDIGENEEVQEDGWQKSYKLRKLIDRGALPPSRFSVEQKTIGQFQMGAPPVSKKLTQFLLNDRRVLRFKGYWDDHTKYGARLYFNIHYYLADNTMEFNEAHCRNSGRYPAPVFFKRGPLRKQNVAHCVPAMLTDESCVYLPEIFIRSMLHVSLAASGTDVAVLDAEKLEEMMPQSKGRAILELKKYLSHQVGCSRFRQRILNGSAVELGDGQEICVPAELQLVILDFWPPEKDEDAKFVSACAQNEVERVAEMLQRPQNPNARDGDGWPALHFAAERGNASCVELLLEARAHLEIRAVDSSSALHCAAFNGQSKVLKLLLDARADKNSELREGSTALHLAADKNHSPVVRLLLDAGAQKNRATDCDFTPLHLAAMGGHSEVVRLLLDADAHKNRAAEYGFTPLHYSAQRCHLEVVRLLLDAGAQRDRAADYGVLPLHLAAMGGHLEVVRLFLLTGAETNQQTYSGYTALHLAAMYQKVEVVRLLLISDAEANARTNSGETALHLAIKHGHLGIVRLLLAAGADIDSEAKCLASGHAEDLRVGDSIDVWGRKVVLFDCDDFTQKFYKDYLDLDQRQNRLDVSEKPVTHLKLTPPPHNGVGKEEDSLISTQMINVKAPKVDLEKLMVYTGEVLRFEAKMANGLAEDEMRVLVIAYYPHDDEVAVFEVPVRNSGHWTGKFADKRRMKNPATGKNFKLSDLVVGTTVTIAGQPLHIVRADERCLRFLEARPREFPYADPVACCRKLAALKGEPEMQDPEGIDPDRLKDLALHLGLDIVDHELVTVLRKFGEMDEEGNLRGWD